MPSRRWPFRVLAVAVAVAVGVSGCAADLGASGTVVPGEGDGDRSPAFTIGSTCGDAVGDADGPVDLAAVTVERVDDRVGVSWTWQGTPPPGVGSTLSLVATDGDGLGRGLVVELDGEEVTSVGVDAQGAVTPVVAELVGSGRSLTVLVDPAVLDGFVGDAPWRAVVAVDGVDGDRCPDA